MFWKSRSAVVITILAVFDGGSPADSSWARMLRSALLAVYFRHHNVKADQIVRFLSFEREPDGLDGFLPVHCDMRGSVLLQEFLHDRAAHEIIFDN